ncbi:MAG: hypothetical protein ACTHZ5_01680 [Micrococcaceae bacterium]
MNADSNPTTLVRLFPDYANTVLWFVGPVPYNESGLTTDLVRELEEWEQSYYASLTPEYEWATAGAAHAFYEEGTRLAQKVADELGPDFEIELRSSVPTTPPRRFRGVCPATNPAAATAFDALAARYAAERPRDGESARDPGVEISGWFAHTPRTGERFTPDR